MALLQQGPDPVTFPQGNQLELNAVQSPCQSLRLQIKGPAASPHLREKMQQGPQNSGETQMGAAIRW